MTDLRRLPVILGAGQVTNRELDPASAPDPLALTVEAARGADPSGRALAALTDCWMVLSLSLRHGDPATELAARLGAGDAQARNAGMGGDLPQWLVNRAADRIAGGEQAVVLIAGAEALATRRRARKEGVTLDWPTTPGFPDTWPPFDADMGAHAAEHAHGLDEATSMYALIESALAHAAGHDPATHRRAMGELMSRCSEVAAANPYSWFPTARGAEEIVTPTVENRMICAPYPKYCNAVMDVDMGAAVIVTDAHTARDLGAAPDEVAYLAGWADASDIRYLSQRPAVHRSPALEACTAAALDGAGLAADDLDGIDLYACFPSSIEAARNALGIAPDDPRALTLTGALPYHGGPGSNYVTHAVANAVGHLRAGGSAALVHGNGFFLTKHAVGVYTSQPPASAPAGADGLQARLNAAARPLPIADAPDGPATVVAHTVPFDRAGEPEAGLLVVDVPGNGRRAVARADEALTRVLVGDNLIGATVHLSPGAAVTASLA